jgi:hypothetical protein
MVVLFELGGIIVISYLFGHPHPHYAHNILDFQDGETSTKLKSSEQGSQIDSFLCTADEQCQANFCKLPVLSPYDQFLTHASC